MRGTVKRAGYHLIGAAADETPSTVIIAEGYATAATLCEASGYAVAVAFDCGNLAPVAQAMSARFPQARLIVAADNDRSTENNPGVRYAQEAARTVGASVAVPSFAQGEDGTDWNDFAALYGLARVAAEVDSAAVSGPLPSEGLKEQAWPLPAPLPAGLPIVNEFSDLILPESLRPWLVDIADRMQCPPDIPAAAAMVALACVVGRKIGIRPKRRDDWTVVPNLWGAVVGRPGILKTPAVEAVLQPLKRLEMAAAESHEAALRQWEADKIVRGEQMKIAKGSIRKQLNAHADAAALARELAAREEPEAPARRRYLVNDSTIEKLGELLSANPNGVLVYRDELIGWLRNLDREGHESARAFYLEAWNGTGRFTYDRIGRGTLDIEAAIVSVFGCIQPGPLRDYLRGAAEGGGADDGLVQRFQVMVWPDTSSEWRNVDRWPDSAAAAKASIVFHKLDNLTADGAGAQRDRLEDAIPFLRFDDAAQEAFDAWRTDLEQRLRSAVEHPALESHLAKYRSLIPTLSLLLHLADGHAGRVGELSLRAAVAWAEYLESHARRIYASVTGDTVPTKALADHLLAGDLPAGFALRDVYRREWSGLRTKEEAQAAIERLEDLRWIRAEEVPPGPSGGRGKTIFRVNPRLAEVVR